MTGSWYVTNNPSTQNMTKQTLGQPLVHQPGQVLAEVVERGDRRHERRATSGSASTSARASPRQANWVNVTGSNTVLPNRPVLGIALDPSSPTRRPADRLRGGRRLQRQHADARRATSSRSTCTANCASFTWANKTGNLPDIPVDSVIVNPNIPQQVFAGTDWGVYYTDDITRRRRPGSASRTACRTR